jgi:uncharacterized protein YbjT (DUF2867 family)
MSGSAAPILVTGATGRHGSTGAHVARRLREEGRPVRILARTPVSLREFVRGNRAVL